MLHKLHLALRTRTSQWHLVTLLLEGEKREKYTSNMVINLQLKYSSLNLCKNIQLKLKVMKEKERKTKMAAPPQLFLSTSLPALTALKPLRTKNSRLRTINNPLHVCSSPTNILSQQFKGLSPQTLFAVLMLSLCLPS